jgi:DNA-binding NarL/FixJ family response regulator
LFFERSYCKRPDTGCGTLNGFPWGQTTVGRSTRVPGARQNDALRLITERYTNTHISELLDISANTATSYVIGLFNKLGVNNRTQAAVLATRNRII